MSTLYYCKKCNSRNHWADERCPEDDRASNSGGGAEQSEEGDEVSKPEGGHSSSADLLPGTLPSKGVESRSHADAGKAQLRRTVVHQKVPKSRGAVSGKKNSVQISKKLGRPKIHPDRKAYMKAFMVKYRKVLKLRKVSRET